MQARPLDVEDLGRQLHREEPTGSLAIDPGRIDSKLRRHLVHGRDRSRFLASINQAV
jgi:hypothetical protein